MFCSDYLMIGAVNAQEIAVSAMQRSIDRGLGAFGVNVPNQVRLWDVATVEFGRFSERAHGFRGPVS